MDFLAPSTWAEALAAKAERPDALPVAGGTDVMVEMNFDHRRPGALLDLTRVAPLGEWAFDDGRVRLGAGVTYARVIAELGSTLPGLAMASRTVGSPQIRNRGTVGGNLGAASPAGDSHPALLAADAVVEVESAARGVRHVPVADFYTGVKRNALEQDELISAVLIAPPSGPQQFCKIGTRNAMVIAVSAFGFALHPDRRAVGTGIGSAAPTPRRATDAAAFLAGELEAAGLWESRAALPEGLAAEFGRKVRDAAAPIDDVRGTAAYRLHTLSVMARRAATWAWDEHRRAA
ncbi:carbon-monoxide dehydrogenase medium subunit [Pseudonocardia sulfidoxydans NBRC 16205]|uniref:Carbon-monoxide dehydrogenase medium subunit n=1 Tax=Pseudonocardia sulfidoxydans NBRC 16205 TaxID=1223511 RepID=A0A511DEG5_9PSEU|nr:FAD binding domain-containing protein [Pseudonocardia sulfidoxydans]GEL23172.1 carbon-monoxide dehydrogenase medium subunit [Pseudonocardia sulfidoxydans NBRC 16205]